MKLSDRIQDEIVILEPKILISGLTTIRNNNGELKLANLTKKVQSLLTITKLVSVFEAYDSLDEAIDSFK